jgi:hypothetical protein
MICEPPIALGRMEPSHRSRLLPEIMGQFDRFLKSIGIRHLAKLSIAAIKITV